MTSNARYDFIIMGGGIVGLATGMFLIQRFPLAKIVLLEKEARVAQHQTGHNSGVIHAGIYYKPGSLKARLARAGNQSMQAFCTEHHIPFERCGKVIVATNLSEVEALQNLYQRGLDNQLEVELLSGEQVLEIEPYSQCVAGIKVPSTGIVDYTAVAHTMADRFQTEGGELFCNTRVTALHRQETGYRVETSQGSFYTRYLINCAGLFSDRLARQARMKTRMKIIPFRGEYYTLRPEKAQQVKGLIYPVPNPNFPFLGVHLTRGIDGSVHVGPNAVLGLKREAYRKLDINAGDLLETLTYSGFWKLAMRYPKEGLQEVLRSFSKALFTQSVQRLMPSINADDLVPAEAGVRAQAIRPSGNLVDDFEILEAPHALHVCNSPSPAATASLEIGKVIVSRIPSPSHLKESEKFERSLAL